MISKSEKEIMSKWKKHNISPMVTVRCMTYNHIRFLSRALDSILSQITDFSFEIIVHDDCSTDGTIELIRKYEKKFPNIVKPIYEEENQYSKHDGTIRKKMDLYTTGKYVAVCEGDDYWIDNNKLQRQIDFLEQNKKYSAVFTASLYLNNGKYVYCDRRSKIERDFNTNEIITGGGDFFATASRCCRREAFLDRYEFQNEAIFGDYPSQIALSLKGKIRYFPEAMVVYREPAGNSGSITTITQKNTESYLKILNNELKWLEDLNSLTDYKYCESIKYRQLLDKYELYRYHAIEKSELNRHIKHMNILIYLKALFKYRIFNCRQTIRSRIPWMRSFLRMIRKPFLR